MMMKFNFGCGPLVLKGTSYDGYALVSVELEDRYDDIPMKVIENVAEKLYSAFNVNYVSLYKDDVCICTIDKEEEGE
jgi:hypothetical protein